LNASMSITIQCPKCAKRYQVADAVDGQRVRCQQCSQVFVAAPLVAYAPAAPEVTADRSLDVDLSKLPAVSAPAPFSPAAPQAWNSGAAAPGISNPSGGPTDTQMRLVSAGMLAAGVVMGIASLALQASQGTVYLAVIFLVPLALSIGLAGVISPNVVRAMGKYGGHLPWHYKVMGWSVLGLSFLLMALLAIGLMLAGYRPDRPGG
jgi:predicted Zn finger-like uncharacterized protein